MPPTRPTKSVSLSSKPYQQSKFVRNKKLHTCTFQQFYESTSKSFSVLQNLKTLKQKSNTFIDQEFIQAIEQKIPKKRMAEFIKRKVPQSIKCKTQQIQSPVVKDQLLGDDNNRRHVKIFSSTFNRQRKKVLDKFQTSKMLRQSVLKKLGMSKAKHKPFFDMQRNHIFSFQDRYRQVFKIYNSKEKQHRSVKRTHPLCQIYDSQAKNVIQNHSFQHKKQVQYEPFGKIDYSAHYF